MCQCISPCHSRALLVQTGVGVVYRELPVFNWDVETDGEMPNMPFDAKGKISGTSERLRRAGAYARETRATKSGRADNSASAQPQQRQQLAENAGGLNLHQMVQDTLDGLFMAPRRARGPSGIATKQRGHPE